MKFTALKLSGAYLVIPDFIDDERGFFARSFCSKEFKDYTLNPNLEQCNISFNHKKGTLRGMHYQAGDFAEAKLVRCTKGSIYDVIIDLRESSTTYKQWIAVELNESNRHMLYIPEGFAHGFQTLQDNTEVFYQMSSSFVPASAKGIRYNDPQFNIIWPQQQPACISNKDAQYEDFMP